MGPRELLMVGIGIAAMLILGGGGAFLMKFFKGRNNTPPKA